MNFVGKMKKCVKQMISPGVHDQTVASSNTFKLRELEITSTVIYWPRETNSGL